MRRSGHPSRPRAITCCFFSSLKTLLIPTKATALRRNQRPRASFSLAGFQVTLIGRFWVTAEGIDARTTRHAGYAISQRKRKRIEECFGWLKTIALMRKLRHRGVCRVDWIFTLACAAYNLVRMRNLAAAVPEV